MGKIIAIDGPAGSGKGTVAKILANELNYMYIDTGAMYRCIALLAIKNLLSEDDEEEIINLARYAEIIFEGDKVILNGQDVTRDIRSMEVTKIVSPISSIVKLREILVEMQRELAGSNNVIMEGRDITTVVFPNADYKFYLDANVSERANRRYKENIEKGINTTYEEILDSIIKRDYNDTHKEVGSLTRTDDAIYIDSTKLTIKQVVKKIKNIVNGKKC